MIGVSIPRNELHQLIAEENDDAVSPSIVLLHPDKHDPPLASHLYPHGHNQILS